MHNKANKATTMELTNRTRDPVTALLPETGRMEERLCFTNLGTADPDGSAELSGAPSWDGRNEQKIIIKRCIRGSVAVAGSAGCPSRAGVRGCSAEKPRTVLEQQRGWGSSSPAVRRAGTGKPRIPGTRENGDRSLL